VGTFYFRDSRTFNAYDSRTGRKLWSFDAGAPILAAPISYRIAGRQYVTVLTGSGTGAGIYGWQFAHPVDYRTQPRRVLTFVLGGEAKMSAARMAIPTPVGDAEFRADQAGATAGEAVFFRHCVACHGIGAVAAGAAPDLRASEVPLSVEAFDQFVRQGMLIPNGMPQFAELTDRNMADLRQYVRTQAAAWRSAQNR
jgi:quinohemoprotein ethanol dehydrogenase